MESLMQQMLNENKEHDQHMDQGDVTPPGEQSVFESLSSIRLRRISAQSPRFGLKRSTINSNNSLGLGSQDLLGTQSHIESMGHLITNKSLLHKKPSLYSFGSEKSLGLSSVDLDHLSPKKPRQKSSQNSADYSIVSHSPNFPFLRKQNKPKDRLIHKMSITPMNQIQEVDEENIGEREREKETRRVSVLAANIMTKQNKINLGADDKNQNQKRNTLTNDTVFKGLSMTPKNNMETGDQKDLKQGYISDVRPPPQRVDDGSTTSLIRQIQPLNGE